jgi:hypothetical protein
MSKVKIKEGTVSDAHDYDIIVNDVNYPNNVEEDLRLDRTILEDEFAGQSDKYAYYSTLAALARDQEAKLKRMTELVYAQADSAARREAMAVIAEDPKRKFTEKMYETMAKTNQDYQKVQLQYLDAKALADKLKGVTEAFSHRKEMLISLGAHARTGASDVRVLGSHVRSSIQKDEPIKEEIVETTTKTSRRKPKKQE